MTAQLLTADREAYTIAQLVDIQKYLTISAMLRRTRFSGQLWERVHEPAGLKPTVTPNINHRAQAFGRMNRGASGRIVAGRRVA